MTLTKRGAIYWYDFWRNGQRYRESTGVKVKRDAEAIEDAKKTEIAMAKVGIITKKRGPIPRFDIAMKQFLEWSAIEHAGKPNTHRRYVISSKALLSYFGTRKLNQIDSETIEDFKNWRRVQKATPKKAKHVKPKPTRQLKPATVNREIACLKAMFFFFIRKKILAENPVSDVKMITEKRSFYVLTPEDEIAYLKECSQPLKDIAIMILESGMRPQDVYSMKINHIRLKQGFYFNPEGKTESARRRIPLTDRAKKMIIDRLQQISGEYLFPGEIEGRSIVKANAAHYGALKRSKLPSFRIYDLRHTFATRFVEAGGDLVTLAQILGHKDLRMVMIYSHPTDPHKLESMRKFENHTRALHKVTTVFTTGENYSKDKEL